MPKKGFEVPLDNWLKNDLKHLVEDSTKPLVLDSLNIKNKNVISNWKKNFIMEIRIILGSYGY